nr:hypothetical protein [Mesorhizobium loti]
MADAVSLAPRLREADRAECWAALGMKPEVVLPMLIQQGNYAWAAEDADGTVEGLFGVDPQDKAFGIVWMVTSPAIFKHRKELVKLAPKWLTRLHKVRPLIGNYIDARNTIHVRWLKRLGFSFLKTDHDYGFERRPFHQFARLRS